MRKRLAAWRKSRPVRWTASVIGFLLALQGFIGLPQLPDQLRSWPPLITGAWDALHGFLGPFTGEWARFFIVLVGMVLLVVLNIPWERFRASPQQGPPLTYDDRRVTYDGDRVAFPNPAADASGDILDVTPEELVAHFEGKTALQGQAEVKGYIGKRLRVSGALAQVHANDRLIVTLQPPRSVDFLYFGAEWTDALAKLSPGDRVEIVGRVQRVLPQGVSLDDCRLVQSSRAAIS